MKVAVVGSGISGIGSAWLLSQHHEVHLFEADRRLGGHAHTVIVDEAGGAVPMDTGFLVYNELTYPNLKSFFRMLQVETVASDMSLSIQVKDKNLEWSGTNLNSIFGQRSNLFRPKFYWMLKEILRFGREADVNLQTARRHAWTLGELLRERKFSSEFCSDYLLPIGAAIWSTPETKMLDFPAATFLTFFINHKLLQVNDRPVWRTVKSGSIQYVEKAARSISRIHLSSPVVEVERKDGRVTVRTAAGEEVFDQVILATHAPITAKMLKFPSDEERRILGSFRTEQNQTYLHRNSEWMPRNRRCWSSWNVYGTSRPDASRQVSLTYYLNLLQPLNSTNDYFLTLNPEQTIRNPIREFQYSHPQFDQTAIRAQRELSSIQGNGGVYFAGAWSRYGFHEDGLLSAVNVARLLGVPIPWDIS